MIKKMLMALFIAISISCHSPKKHTLKNDSVEIFLAALKSKSFLKGNILSADSLFFLKSKYYYKDFPTQTPYFKLFYIENTSANKVLNFPGKNSDKRERYDITTCKINNDTANFILFNPGVRESYSFKLKKVDEKWEVIKEEVILY